MNNEHKLEEVKTTLKNLLNILKESDRLCLVKFSDESSRLTPLISINASNKHIFLK